MEELQELLTEELRDLYDAEKQLVKALPKVAKAVSDTELRDAVLEHLEVTKNQVTRLEQVFEQLGERPKSKPCKAMKGLVEEASEHISEHEKGAVLDSVLIIASQKVEHYEIAAYGSARAMAKSLGNREALNLLQETLKEEEQTDKKLTTIALRIQKEMISAPRWDEDEAESSSRNGGGGSKKKSSSSQSLRQTSSSGGSRAAVTRSGGGGASGRKGSSASTAITTDHDEIRRWAEERGAKPACVRGTGKKGDTGMIRLDFPGYSGSDSLQEISWEEWFEKFDEQGLALLHQGTTASGEQSNFNKLVGRDTAEISGKKSRSSGGSSR